MVISFLIHSSYILETKLSLNAPCGKTLDEMPAENEIQRQHRDGRQRQHGEDFGPVGLVLSEQARYAQQKRF